MLLDYVTKYETVQFAAMFGFGVWGLLWLVMHYGRKTELLKSEDQRQKDAIPIERRIGKKEYEGDK